MFTAPGATSLKVRRGEDASSKRGWLIGGALGTQFMLLGCGAATDVGSCPVNAETEVAAGEKLVQACNSCHSYDTQNLSTNQALGVWDTVESGSMPPGRSLDDAQTEQVRAFLACTTDAGSGDGGSGGSAGGVP